MKTKITLILITITTFCNAQQYVYIPDFNFKAKLISLGIDANQDNEISVSEAQSVVMSLDLSYSSIYDLTGIEAFDNVGYLDISHNNIVIFNNFNCASVSTLNCRYSNLYNLDLTGVPNLTNLYCNDNHITTLDISNLQWLQAVECSSNQMTSLNINNNPQLSYLSCLNNLLTTINTNQLTLLFHLNCSINNISSLDFTANQNLEFLGIGYNQLTSVDVSNLIHLESFGCDGNNLLTYVNIKNGVIETGANFLYNPNLQNVCADEGQIAYIQNQVSSSCLVTSNCSLAVDSFEIAEISLFPNPINDIINIKTNSNIKKVEVFEISGRMLKTYINIENYINIKDLQSGNYVLKIYTEYGVINKKIIKK